MKNHFKHVKNFKIMYQYKCEQYEFESYFIYKTL